MVLRRAKSVRLNYARRHQIYVRNVHRFFFIYIHMCRDETFILSVCVLYIFDYLFMVGRHRRRRNGEMVTTKKLLGI